MNRLRFAHKIRVGDVVYQFQRFAIVLYVRKILHSTGIFIEISFMCEGRYSNHLFGPHAIVEFVE